MANFLLLYSGGGMPETEAEQAAVMAQWMAWYGKLGDAVVDGGKPIGPIARGIGPDGTVNDNPAVTMVSGYSIIKADSMDDAVEKAKGCPILGGHNGQISVFETFDTM